MLVALIILGVLSVGAISAYIAEIGYQDTALLVFCVSWPAFLFGLFAYFGAF